MGFLPYKKYSDLDIHKASCAMSKNFICVKFFGGLEPFFQERFQKHILRILRILTNKQTEVLRCEHPGRYDRESHNGYRLSLGSAHGWCPTDA